MQTPTTFDGLVNEIIGVINVFIPLLFGLVFVYFVWKIIDAWIINAGDEQKREEGKRLSVIAVIVLVLMIVSWGIVAIIQQAFFG